MSDYFKSKYTMHVRLFQCKINNACQLHVRLFQYKIHNACHYFNRKYTMHVRLLKHNTHTKYTMHVTISIQNIQCMLGYLNTIHIACQIISLSQNIRCMSESFQYDIDNVC